ncbi:hypothetical protein B9H02_08715 [Prosthecochloris sp. HL-130-GSB]|nr:hypothetical protein B9H02_08715 [Prosthecochloris sp. HL-130-GSB]
MGSRVEVFSTRKKEFAMNDTFTVKGRQLVVKEVPSSDPDIIIDVAMWKDLIKAEVIRITSGD